MATRSHVREVVVQLLYAYSSGNDAIFKFADEIFEEHKIKNKQKDFANLLFNGVIENLESLDLRIAHQLESWDFSKIGDGSMIRCSNLQHLGEGLRIGSHSSFDADCFFGASGFISIGDDVIAQSASRGNNAYKKRTGVALI